jgi:hypothetical protein
MLYASNKGRFSSFSGDILKAFLSRFDHLNNLVLAADQYKKYDIYDYYNSFPLPVPVIFLNKTNKNRHILPAISHLINVHKVIRSLVVFTEY